MKMTAHPAIAGLTFFVVLPCASASGQEAPSPVAIVCALTGTASLTLPAKKRTTTLRLFEWLSPGSVVEVARESSVTLVFSSGVRYELGGTAKATAGTSALASSSGPVRHLPAVPPLPRLSPIGETVRAGPRSGAVRIRGATMTHLYPDAGSATLADSTVLRFMPAPDASRYRVEVETETGISVFHMETPSSMVNVARGILKPGAKYYWQVRTLDRIGQVARGAAEFVTLSAATARAREALKESLEVAGDSVSLALLAEIDRRLGLHVEAREVPRGRGQVARRRRASTSPRSAWSCNLRLIERRQVSRPRLARPGGPPCGFGTNLGSPARPSLFCSPW